MAAKTGKGKSKGNASSRLNDAMNSINNNRTPISSILPVQKKGSFLTGSKKGQRGSNPLAGPSKLLLAITEPGSRPTEPTNVTSPSDDNGRTPNSSYISNNRLQSYAPREGWNTRHRSYTSEKAAFEAAVSNRSTYNSDLSNYQNTELPNWTTSDNEYQGGITKNKETTSQYQKDLAKFFSKTNKSVKTSSPGSRSSISSTGSRR